MSILIKGMKMPASCDVCDFAVELNERELGTHLYCGFPGIGVYVDDCVFSVHKDCPLIEIPPHGRLIDAGELAKFPIRRDHYDEKNGDIHFINGIETLMEYADCLPTILEAEEADG